MRIKTTQTEQTSLPGQTVASAEEVRFSPRYWTHKNGNYWFVVTFPLAMIASCLLGCIKVFCCDVCTNQTESDGEQQKGFFESCYTGPIPCLYNRSLKQVMGAVFSFYDVISDFQYIITVPIYTYWILGPMIASLALSFAYSVLIGLSPENGPNPIELKDGDPLAKKILAVSCNTLAAFTGLFTLLAYRADHKELDESKVRMDYAFGVVEDCPQFVFQGLNSFLLGKTLTWIQVVSPLLSIYGIVGRIMLNLLTLKGGANNACWMWGTCSWIMYCSFPFYLVAINLMSMGGKEADFCQDGPLFDGNPNGDIPFT